MRTIMAMMAAAMAPSTGASAEQGLRTAARCDAGRLQEYVGARYTPAFRRMVEGRERGRTIRWIMPGSAITQEHSPDRGNLEVGDDGFILKAWCG